MITAAKSNDHTPGTWKPLQLPDGRRTATFTCPKGHHGSLSDHDIMEDGQVHPSVLCMTEGCGFHEFVKLEGWADGPQEKETDLS